ESEAFRLEEHPTLLCVRALPSPVPNPIQIQLRMFFASDDDGWAFPYDLLEEPPQRRMAPFRSNGETPLLIGHEDHLACIKRSQQRTYMIGNALRDRMSRFDHQTFDRFGLWSVQKHFDSS